MIKIEGLTLRYPGAESAALENLQISVAPARIFGLLGPNGAGKSSLMSVLAGLCPWQAGRVEIAGWDAATQRGSINAILGYVPQSLAFYPGLTVSENLDLFGALTSSSTARIGFALETAMLQKHAARRAGQLSGGLQRRLNFAIGLLGDPQLLLLDEPTVGVDPQSRRFILETVRSLSRGGLTVVYTSHYMDEIERVCDDIVVLDHGHILAAGTPAQLLSGGDADLEALFLRLTGGQLRDEA